MKNYNIWYLHPYSGGPHFGNSGRAFHLGLEWKALKHDVTIFCASWHHLMGLSENIYGTKIYSGISYSFIPVRKYNGNGLSRLLNMFDYCFGFLLNFNKHCLEFGKPDVIIVSSPHPFPIIISKILSVYLKSKLIFEVRDLWPLSLIELVGKSRWNPFVVLVSYIERFAYRHADACVSLLPNAKSYMVQNGLPSENFYYIPNGAIFSSKLSEFDFKNEILSKVRNLRKAGSFVVIYTGAMGVPNNMKILIEAAKILSDQKTNIYFVLMGQGSELDFLKIKSKEYNLKNVIFYPHSNRSIALRLMNEASAGYVSVKKLPIYEYGISFNKLFEYMQQELPVVFAADVPANPVELSNCGVVTSPDDATLIAKTIYNMSLKDKNELSMMGRLGRCYVEKNHNYKILAKNYIKVFKRLS